ncbi:MAG: hypothetical protein AAF433_08445 [Bacteroidota bacterium]
MNSFHQSIRKANATLSYFTSRLGPVVYPDPATAQATLERFEREQSDDSFYFYFDLPSNNIKRVGKNMKPLLGVSHLDFQGWLGLIHPDFIEIYLEFGVAAYQAGLKFKAEIKNGGASYSINVPIKRLLPNGEEEYWLVKQTAYPFEFDANDNMVSHLNTYTLISRFQKYVPMPPFVLINHQVPNLLEEEIRKITQESVLLFFYTDLAERHKRTLLSYWQAFSRHKADKNSLPNSASIAQQLAKSPQTIQDYNKAILEASRAAFPLTEFTDMLSVASFLFDLYGPITD